MNNSNTVELKVHFTTGRSGRRELHIGERVEPIQLPPKPRRVATLMKVAIYLEEQLRRGVFRDYAHIARDAYITRTRVSQIMDLLLLAPDIQAAIILNDPRAARWTERRLRALPRLPDWNDQRASLSITP
jgi:hypothetical protein